MTGPLRIVAIGGGTGLSSLLSGLKKYARDSESGEPLVDITAIVTVTDDGGSSGRLRREFDVLPPGDIRNCMVALSEDEALLSRLFQYRFQSGHGLKGHSFGNLFLTAMTHVVGDFPEAVSRASEVLNIAGRIFPSTAANVSLEAVLDDGRVVKGETRISRSQQRIRTVRLVPEKVKPLRDTLDAIANADLITLGPGSLFTSVVPNLLVTGIPEAIKRSRALKAYVVNLMSQPGETTSFAASDHLAAVCDHAGGRILDYAIISTSKVSSALRKRYAEMDSAPILNDAGLISSMGIEIIEADLLMKGPKVRHNPTALARVAVDLAIRGQRMRRLAKLKANAQ